jgi:hypothetical protein
LVLAVVGVAVGKEVAAFSVATAGFVAVAGVGLYRVLISMKGM